ncbi:MAG: hypothetical protein ABJG47_11235 [Ekhidna sp.]
MPENIAPQPKNLIAFKTICQSKYIGYSMASYGMTQVSKDLQELEGYNPEGMFQIGSDPKKPIAEIKNRNAMLGMQKNGPFSQMIGMNIIVSIYTMWEEVWRKKIAEELKLENKNEVGCDVMGEVNRVRQAIVHHDSFPIDDFKPTIFEWPLTEEGRFWFTSKRA